MITFHPEVVKSYLYLKTDLSCLYRATLFYVRYKIRRDFVVNIENILIFYQYNYYDDLYIYIYMCVCNIKFFVILNKTFATSTADLYNNYVSFMIHGFLCN